MAVICTTVRHLSDLRFPGYRTKYVENVIKGSLRWVFMEHRLNVYLKPWFFSHVKKEHYHIFPEDISAVSVTSFDSYRPSKWQKVHKLGVINFYRLKIFHRLTVYVGVIFITVADLSDLPLLTYRGKYGKNVEKKKSKYGLHGPQKQF